MKKTFLFIALIFMSFSVSAIVKFPSQQQPKKAKISSTTNSWSLSNNLFSATYTLGNGNLFFAGSDVFGLNKSNELFRITLADGTVVSSSEMQCDGVVAKTIKGEKML